MKILFFFYNKFPLQHMDTILVVLKEGLMMQNYETVLSWEYLLMEGFPSKFYRANKMLLSEHSSFCRQRRETEEESIYQAHAREIKYGGEGGVRRERLGANTQTFLRQSYRGRGTSPLLSPSILKQSQILYNFYQNFAVNFCFRCNLRKFRA